MLGLLSFQNSLFICSDASRLRFLPDQTPKSAFFKSFNLHQSIPIIPFRCLVVSSKDAFPSINLITSKKSKDVISLFYSYGFSEDQVKMILHKHRWLLKASSEKTIRPKLDYFLSFRYSELELTTLISSDPHLLAFNLEKRIMNNKNLLKQLLGSEELVKRTISHASRILKCNLERDVVPNLEILRMHGVIDKRIAQALVCHPRIMTKNPDKIGRVVMELKKLGMDPSSTAFIVALNAKIAMRQSVWDGKEALYKSFGWSDENFLLAFTKHPSCMLNSEEKIKKMMEFYVKKLGWDPAFLSKLPVLISLSLESFKYACFKGIA